MIQKYILLSILMFACVVRSQQKVTIAERPLWVTYQEVDANPTVAIDKISQGTLTLLADYQINTATEESYYRLVRKITDKVGIQTASNVNATYDPLYQKLFFHEITITRNGKIINKLFPEHFQVIRRELNAENYLYDGSLSAMLQLSDVRDDDIIDVSYTVKGFNPIHNGKYADSFVLNDYVPVGKIHVSVLAESTLKYKLFNTNLEPKISTKGSYTHYVWEVISPELALYEEGVPSWSFTMPTVVLSTFESWKEVVDWAIEIYAYRDGLSSNIQMKLEEIEREHSDEGERIKAVLNFVQDDIRYLGLEYGISAYKPNAPNKVFEQRYGDCKDKSLLMVEMLREIGVEAYPMLVNTSMKHVITKMLPSPTFFDHCVVKVVDSEQRYLYYDPTLSNQGGTYKSTHFPNYEYGLVVKENTVAFDTIYSASENRVDIQEVFNIPTLDGEATLAIKSTFTDVEADRMRTFFKSNSLSSIQKEYENYYADFFTSIKMSGLPVIKDNKKKNEFVVEESYNITDIWSPIPMKPGFVGIDFYPLALQDALFIPNMAERKYPIALSYPVARAQTTRVKLPTRWSIKKEEEVISNDMFYYEFSTNFGRNNKEIILKNFFKTQKPSVSVDELDKYDTAIKKMEESVGYSIFIQSDDISQKISRNGQSEDGNSNFIHSFLLYVTIILLLILAVLIIWVKKNQTL